METLTYFIFQLNDMKENLEMIILQVAHFYNTIDQQMIPSQQAMMLDSALAFERLIKNPKAGEWGMDIVMVSGICHTPCLASLKVIQIWEWWMIANIYSGTPFLWAHDNKSA